MLTVRNARKEDACQIADLIVQAWPTGQFLKMSPEITYSSLVDAVTGYVKAEDTLYSFRNTIVAYDDVSPETILGIINGYDGAKYREMKKPIEEDLAKRFRLDNGTGFAAAEETSAGEFYIDSAAVVQGMRSKGIGSMLFKAMLLRARKAGFSTVGLLVDIGKPEAEALYVRLGFTFVEYKDFLGHKMKHLQKKV